MNLEYITCSDMREYNEIDDIIDLGKRYPMAEFAIQAHPSKFSAYMPRYVWFDTLAHASRVNDINLAMHVNAEWRTEICRGNIPYEIKRMWDMRRDNGKHVIGRVQVNINGGKDSFRFYANKVSDIIRAYPDIEFIFQYTTRQRNRLKRLDKMSVPFSMLFDASGGRGISPDTWRAPVMPNHKMGYSGGLSPENVADNLDKINMVLPVGYNTWIDAEGKLKDPDTKQFDTLRAEQYIQNAIRRIVKNK
ncbi:MAG: hypothetical protein IJQ90_01730 [Alphaproteobacteria bacterium]|nr:hypothetical protein [Alphaproteobacteria bacterium]